MEKILSGKLLTGLLTGLITATIASGFSASTQAAGFALIENSASGMGNAFAGGSAIAEDASTVWFNPAGMTRLSGSQIIVAGHIVSPSADYTDTGSTINPSLGGGALTGTNDDGGESGFVPNFYYTTELGNDSYFGVGVSVPFGLSTEYDSGWVGRYTATKSEVHAININPSFASKVTDKLSIGFGLNIQYIEATLSNKLDSGAICTDIQLLGVSNPTPAQVGAAIAACAVAGLPIATQAVDSSQSLTADDISTGWNFGLLYDLDTDSRLGLAYRSSIKHKVEGDVDFQMNATLAGIISGLPATPFPLNTLFSDTNLTAGLELPESLSVSYFRDVDSKLSVMADITWTKWRNFEEIIIVFDSVQPSSTIPEDWQNNYRFSLGASYKADDKLTYRAGIALDQTPIKSPELRTPRIPGNDRTWLSVGIGYNISSDMSIDVGYSHLLVDDTDINNTDASFGHTITGTYEADVDILSAQANFKF